MNIARKVFGGSCLALLAAGAVYAASAPPGAKVMILEPMDGATVSSPVVVKFGAQNIEIVPAGTDKPNSGHHHLLIDTKEIPAMGAPIAKDDRNLHFGKGQTETTLTLTPGTHTLRLVVGDKDHVPHHPPVMSELVTITVK